MSYKLVRKDGLVKESKEVRYIEFCESGLFKTYYNEPRVNCSLLMSPFNISFTWQTTLITELMEVREDYVSFKTENSEYELIKIEEDGK